MTPRVLRVAGPAILGGVALIALVGALWFGGGAAQIPLGDAGPVVRWGLPVTKLVVNLAAAGMVGVLVTALFTLRAGEREFDVALDTASISAALFTVAAGATGFLTLLSVFNPAIDAGPQFGAQLGRFLVELEVGRTWLITTVAGAALTVLTFAVRSWVGTLLVALVAVASLVPMGTQGHSGDDAFHHEAMMALILHIIGAAVWLGGLLLLIAVRPALDRRRIPDLVARYSSIALAAFVLVAVSGTVRAAIGLQEWSDLLSPYGAILGIKVVARRPRPLRGVVPHPPDRQDAQLRRGIPPFLDAHRVRAGTDGCGQRRRRSAGPHSATEPGPASRDPLAGRTPHRCPAAPGAHDRTVGHRV